MFFKLLNRRKRIHAYHVKLPTLLFQRILFNSFTPILCGGMDSVCLIQQPILRPSASPSLGINKEKIPVSGTISTSTMSASGGTEN